MMTSQSIFIGCGTAFKEGFLHVDRIPMQHIDLMCEPWQLSHHVLEADHIHAENLLQRLSNFEADRALHDWFKALKSGGLLRIIVPDMDFYAKQWLNAAWSNDALRDPSSDAKQSFSALWGTQEQCDPWDDDYNQEYRFVHKSGYNQARLSLLLSRVGFIDITITNIDERSLEATATKPKYSGERQVGTTLDTIRMDHRKRYEFASKYITKKDAVVVDAACGVGYGSYILAQNEHTKMIQGLDISHEALEHARQYFNHEKIDFRIVNLADDALEIQPADYFISFETIEHLPCADTFFEKISHALKPEGLFIGSTPNEEIMPFVQQNFLFHTKHFTLKELKTLLQNHGFTPIAFFQQKRDAPSEVSHSNDGQYIIFIAQKTG